MLQIEWNGLLASQIVLFVDHYSCGINFNLKSTLFTCTCTCIHIGSYMYMNMYLLLTSEIIIIDQELHTPRGGGGNTNKTLLCEGT